MMSFRFLFICCIMFLGCGSNGDVTLVMELDLEKGVQRIDASRIAYAEVSISDFSEQLRFVEEMGTFGDFSLHVDERGAAIVRVPGGVFREAEEAAEPARIPLYLTLERPLPEVVSVSGRVFARDRNGGILQIGGTAVPLQVGWPPEDGSFLPMTLGCLRTGDPIRDDLLRFECRENAN